MRILLLPLLAVTAAGAARADEAGACRDGIAAIRAELQKTPAEPVRNALRRHLRIAERELDEREYDECLDAVKDARRALPR
ncbi:hypothetical protein [uncultured Methylobacterium sp.]|jgi:hypothetical protein|uniref:hypothetical protein n=1 Tax=uncultured Methylobacterium sp. TaxID=157278 RepID=UPI0026098F6E|nr:hypothetical protein [uncultured Methylobacterium sp.]